MDSKITDAPASIEGLSLVRLLDHCGLFQWTITSTASLPKVVSALFLYFMAFGSYNPGWKCLDNVTISDANVTESWNGTSSNSTGTKSPEYLFDSCPEFESCQRVKFNPEVATIVTEFGLVCDRAWITPFITSIQMAGLAVGAFLVGYFGDRFGRKLTMCASLLIFSILNLISMHSVTWQMFATLQFFLGIMSGFLVYLPSVLILEFLPSQWRAPFQSIPLWNVGTLTFCALAVFTQDWKSIVMITTIISSSLFILSLFVPESLRWLITNGKYDRAFKVAKRVSEMNRFDVTEQDVQGMLVEEKKTHQDKETKERHYVSELFRHRLKYTLVLTACFFIMDMLYFATSFAVAIFPGNVYVNMIIMSASELPSNLVATFVPNIVGRRKTVVTTFLIAGSCYVCLVFIDRFASQEVMSTCVLSFIILGKISLNVAWYTLSIVTVEVYPTILRSTAVGHVGLCAGLGSIVAPFLFPTSVHLIFISYIMIATVCVICGCSALLLPETKGAVLLDTWEDQPKSQRGDNGVV